ncbi:transaldolase [Candidatus Woesebacteria bacterium]|nr:transaldolase [Candidatus Woesebacteria bacterium]
MEKNQPLVFLDSGNPEETRKAKKLLGTLDGQTTNPSLVVKNPDVASYVANGKKLTEIELLKIYKDIILELAKELPDGHISVEVNAHWESTAADLLAQAMKMAIWAPQVNIKFPTTNAGVEAAHEFVKTGGRVNMTLVFDQIQAAAVYAATRDAEQQCFISPFMGRWDDRGFNGADLINNIVQMYEEYDLSRQVDPHVLVLAASIRNMDHLYASIYYGADILTIPLKTIEAWVTDGKKIPDKDYLPAETELAPIPYREIEIGADYKAFDIKRIDGTLLDEGLKKFAADWESLLA